jgi:hypothetical protein
MKTFIAIIGTLTLLLLITQAFILKSSSKIEQHKYSVIKTYDNFEVRRYAKALFSSVKLNEKSYEEVSGKGFRVLAGYIFGNNVGNEKIAMTSPVAMEIGDSSKMSFMVPAGYSVDNLPKPTDNKIYFEVKEEAIMAAIQFGGWASDEKIEEYKNKLIADLAKEKLKFTGSFSYLGYNPPYEVFNRRNEIVIELVNYK